MEGSVSKWVASVKTNGDQEAMRLLWKRYTHQLAEFICRRLRNASQRVADEEDVISQTFQACFDALKDGRYPQLIHRNEFWGLISRTAARKTQDQIAHETCEKRGGGRVRGDSAMIHDNRRTDGFDQLAGETPAPEADIVFAEEWERILETLASKNLGPPLEELRQIIVYASRGCSNQEIAEKLQCSKPTVERRRRLIRTALKEGFKPPGDGV